MGDVRNRIKEHRRVRAGDLVPHEQNPRRHSKAQRQALRRLYEEIGFARSLLAYELPDGRLKLIDGHLRADMDPDMPVDVEVLDVNDAEARALLLAIDPLAQLADIDSEQLGKLREQTEAMSPAVRNLWALLTETGERTRTKLQDLADRPTSGPQFLIVVTCTNEAQQLALLKQFQEQGLKCEAKLA